MKYNKNEEQYTKQRTQGPSAPKGIPTTTVQSINQCKGVNTRWDCNDSVY